MSAQSSPLGTSSWALWPVGDRYQLSPKWEESHADTDSTVRPQDEKNRLDLVGDYRASEVYFTLQLRDMDDPKNPVVPTEEPVVEVFLERTEGWIDSLEPVPVMIQETAEPTDLEPDPQPAWNGDVRIDIDATTRAWLGYERTVSITIDASFPSDAPQRIRVGYGSLVLRR
jgi:hypothetical protein